MEVGQVSQRLDSGHGFKHGDHGHHGRDHARETQCSGAQPYSAGNASDQKTGNASDGERPYRDRQQRHKAGGEPRDQVQIPLIRREGQKWAALPEPVVEEKIPSSAYNPSAVTGGIRNAEVTAATRITVATNIVCDG